jgi:hypothetical protein
MRTMVTDALYAHRDLCETCQRGDDCGIATALLQRLVDRMLPSMPVVLDLEAHKATCLRCRGDRLCAEGRGIVTEAGTAIRDAARGGVRRMGRA